MRVASKLAHGPQWVPGIVDSHVFQVPDAPALTVDMDRALATSSASASRAVPAIVLVTHSTPALQIAPNFWLDPHNSVSYPLVVQMPTYHIDSTQDLWTLAGDGGQRAKSERRC